MKFLNVINANGDRFLVNLWDVRCICRGKDGVMTIAYKDSSQIKDIVMDDTEFNALVIMLGETG